MLTLVGNDEPLKVSIRRGTVVLGDYQSSSKKKIVIGSKKVT